MAHLSLNWEFDFEQKLGLWEIPQVQSPHIYKIWILGLIDDCRRQKFRGKNAELAFSANSKDDRCLTRKPNLFEIRKNCHVEEFLKQV